MHRIVVPIKKSIIFMKIYFIVFTVFIFSCNPFSNKGVDTVKDNETVAVEGSVKEFDVRSVTGKFNGKFNGKDAMLELHKNGSYSLFYNSNNFKGKYFYTGDGSMLQLNNNSSQFPFEFVQIESPNNLTILDKDMAYTEYYLEK